MEDATTPLSNDVNGVEEFIKLMEDLNSLPPQTPGLEKLPAEGEMCCAKFSQDGRWYRGLVVSVYLTTNTVLIFYIDYGNSEIVPLQRLTTICSFWCGPNLSDDPFILHGSIILTASNGNIDVKVV